MTVKGGAKERFGLHLGFAALSLFNQSSMSLRSNPVFYTNFCLCPT